MSKKIIQVCVSLENGLDDKETLREKMIELKERLDKQIGAGSYEVRSCHLTREMCIEKGFSTDVADTFDEIFGEDYICELVEESYEEAMKNIDTHRTELSNKADYLIVFSEEAVTNVALEIELFTEHKVIII